MRHRSDRRPADADPWGKEALLHDGKIAASTSVAGQSLLKQIGMGYVRTDLAEVGTKLKVRMFRELLT